MVEQAEGGLFRAGPTVDTTSRTSRRPGEVVEPLRHEGRVVEGVLRPRRAWPS